MDLQTQLEMIQEQRMAPKLGEEIAEKEDEEEVAEVCAEVETYLQEKCQERGLNKHAGIAVCYLVVNRLADE